MIAAPPGERPSARVCACNCYDGVVHESCFRRRKKDEHQKKKNPTKQKKFKFTFDVYQIKNKKMFKRWLKNELRIMMAKKKFTHAKLWKILYFVLPGRHALQQRRSEASYARCTRADWREKWRPSLTGDDTPRPTAHKRADASALLLLVFSGVHRRYRARASGDSVGVRAGARLVDAGVSSRSAADQYRRPADSPTTMRRPPPPPARAVALLSGLSGRLPYARARI